MKTNGTNLSAFAKLFLFSELFINSFGFTSIKLQPTAIKIKNLKSNLAPRKGSNSFRPPLILSSSSSSSPDASELAQQKFETINSFSDFNDGKWSGSATSFAVKSDIAAGVTKTVTLNSYETVCATSLDADGLLMTETFSWDEENGDAETDGASGPTKVSTRKVRIGESMDVDSVDGSYSLDAPLLDLPSTLSGTNAVVKFAIEHSLAVSDTERVRMFVLYGMDDCLIRVVMCNEERQIMSEEERMAVGDFSSSGDVDMEKDMDNLISKITGEDQSSSITQQEQNPSSSSEENRMDQLMKAINSKNEPSSDQGNPKEGEMSVGRHPMTLFGLVSGVWLGDMVIRNHPTPRPQKKQSSSSSGKKGFGAPSSKKTKATSPKPGSGISDGFAEWDTGVQKIAMTFRWDYEKKVRQRLDVGRSMGVGISDDMPMVSMGNVITNYMARGKNPEERMVCIDFDYGAYLSFIAGSVMVKVPRTLSFSQRTGEIQPFHTEFSVFQQRSMPSITESNDQEENLNAPELFCSKLTRLYGKHGKLSQATSAFYSIDRSAM